MAEEESPPGQTEPESVDARERIFRVIRDSPGAHVREIERRSGYAYGAVEYHLRRLEKAGAVRVVEDGNLRTYFAADFPKEDRPLAALVRRNPIRKILIALLTRGKVTHGELAKEVGMSPSTVTHHLKKLISMGVVSPETGTRGAPLSIANPAAVDRALLVQRPSLADPALDAYIAAWQQWRRPGGGKKSPYDAPEAPKQP